MATTARPKMLYPFRAGTRKRRQYLTSFTYDGSTTQQRPTPFMLPNVGMLSRLMFTCSGNIDNDGMGALGVDGAAALFNRITVNTNLGSALLHDASGPGSDIAARWENPFAARADDIDPTDTTAAFFYAFCVNIGANRKKQFALGLINLQDPEIQVQLSLVFNPLTQIISTATSGGTSLITVNVWYEYYEIPDPLVFALPPRALVRTLEEQFPNSTRVGDNIYQVPRLGTMFMLSCIGYANGARLPVANVDALAIRFNKTDIIEERDGLLQVLLDQTDFGIMEGNVPGNITTTIDGTKGATTLQVGVFTWNGWEAEDVPSNGDFRDAIDTLELTTTEFILTVATGTTVVSTDIIRVVRRLVQVLG